MYCDLAVSSSGLPRLFTRQALKMLGFGKVMISYILTFVCFPKVGGLDFADEVSNFLGLLAAMKELTKSMCWNVVKITKDKVNKVGIAIYQKPASNECYEKRSQNEPPLCQASDDPNAAWYIFSFFTIIFFSFLNLFPFPWNRCCCCKIGEMHSLRRA